jgi:hypothetical protein
MIPIKGSEEGFCVPRKGSTRAVPGRVVCDKKPSSTVPSSVTSHLSSLNHHFVMSIAYMVRRQLEAHIPSIPSSILPTWLKPIVEGLMGLFVLGICASAYRAGRTRFGSWKSIRKSSVDQGESHDADEQSSSPRR